VNDIVFSTHGADDWLQDGFDAVDNGLGDFNAAAAPLHEVQKLASLARDAAELPADQPRYRATVSSLLFDGANSAVLVREEATRAEIRIALPQTGRFADLRPDETIAFGFDPQRAVCFRAGGNGR
jgi:hypothetical protein